MTREECKSLLPIIAAFAEGKEVQWRVKSNGYPEYCWNTLESSHQFEGIQHEFRIKPEKKVIPFDFSDAKDIIGKAIKHKRSNLVTLIFRVGTSYIRHIENDDTHFKTLMDDYTFIDGSSCGKEVEE